MCLLGALGTTYRVMKGICTFVETPRCRTCYWLGPHTPTTSTRDQKEYGMCILEALGTTYRVIRGICRFVETPRYRIFYWLGPSNPATSTRDQKR